MLTRACTQVIFPDTVVGNTLIFSEKPVNPKIKHDKKPFKSINSLTYFQTREILEKKLAEAEAKKFANKRQS